MGPGAAQVHTGQSQVRGEEWRAGHLQILILTSAHGTENISSNLAFKLFHMSKSMDRTYFSSSCVGLIHFFEIFIQVIRRSPFVTLDLGL